MAECVHRTFGHECAQRHLGTLVPGGRLAHSAACCSNDFHPDSVKPARGTYICELPQFSPGVSHECPPLCRSVILAPGCTCSPLPRVIPCVFVLELRLRMINHTTMAPGITHIFWTWVAPCVMIVLRVSHISTSCFACFPGTLNVTFVLEHVSHRFEFYVVPVAVSNLRFCIVAKRSEPSSKFQLVITMPGPASSPPAKAGSSSDSVPKGEAQPAGMAPPAGLAPPAAQPTSLVTVAVASWPPAQGTAAGDPLLSWVGAPPVAAPPSKVPPAAPLYMAPTASGTQAPPATKMICLL